MLTTRQSAIEGVSLRGLPNPISPRLLRGHYNDAAFTYQLQRAVKWWWARSIQAIRDAVAASLEAGYVVQAPLLDIARAAMSCIMLLGASAGTSMARQARKGQRGLRPPMLRRVQFAAGEFGAGAQDWFPVWNGDKEALAQLMAQARQAVGPELADIIHYTSEYVLHRQQPIVGLQAAEARRVDVLVAEWHQAYQQGKTMQQFLRENVGGLRGFPTYRLNNIIWTEEATMFNMGELAALMADDITQAVEFVAIVDERTTEFCREINGKVQLLSNLEQAPPFHYQCRTRMMPVFEWDDGKLKRAGKDLPVIGEGRWQAPPYRGFGLTSDVRRLQNTLKGG